MPEALGDRRSLDGPRGHDKGSWKGPAPADSTVWLVELLGRYSNQDRLLTVLQGLLEVEGVRSPDLRPRPVRQVQRRLRAEQQAELLERYLAGERAFVLAKDFGVDPATVSKLLSETGVRRSRSMTDEERIEAAQLYDEGLSCARIGERLGRDPGAVWLALKKAGVKLRPPSSRVEDRRAVSPQR